MQNNSNKYNKLTKLSANYFSNHNSMYFLILHAKQQQQVQQVNKAISKLFLKSEFNVCQFPTP